MTHVTLFKSSFDVRTKNFIKFQSFDKFERWMYKLSKIPMSKPKKGEMIDIHHAPLISPAVYNEGPDVQRCNKEVVAWGGWAALDVDEFDGEEYDIETFGLKCVVYSTASSQIGKLKFRMVFPLTSYVDAEEIPDFWYALNRRMGGLGDEQVKDLSRMYYVPGHYTGAYNFIHSIDGDPINPQVLIRDFPRPIKPKKDILSGLPPEMQKEYLQYKLGGMGREKSWTGWRDCPFINDELVHEYQSIVGTGWYHKLYSIMVSIACSALRQKYMITAQEIADLTNEIHLEVRGWPTKRNLLNEAERAIEFAVGEVV